MKVSEIQELLKKFDPNEMMFFSYFSKGDFVMEFNDWNDNKPLDPPLTDEEWRVVVEGTLNDDRIAEAINECMRFDFNKLLEDRQAKEVSEQDLKLWEE